MNASEAVDLASLRSGTGRFKNVPHAVCEVLAAVVGDLASLRTSVDSVPKFSDLTAAVASKPSKRDVEGATQATLARVHALAEVATSAREDLRTSTDAELQRMTERVQRLEGTVSALASTVAGLQAQLAEKADKSALASLAPLDALHRKADAARLEEALASKASVEALRAVQDEAVPLPRFRAVEAAVEAACTQQDMQAAVEGLRGMVQERCAAASDNASGAAAAAAEARALAEGLPSHKQVKGVVRQALAPYATQEQVASAVQEAVGALGRQVEGSVRQSLGEVIAVVNDKAFKADVARGLASKASDRDVRGALASKADRAEVAEALRSKAESGDVTSLQVALREVQLALADRGEAHGPTSAATAASAAAAEAGIATVAASVRRLEEALAGKADRGEVAALTSSMGEACGGQAARHSGTASPAGVDSSEATATQGPAATSGRWLWKSRDLDLAGCIPWDMEAWNTRPEALTFRRGEAGVQVSRGGLYELCAGIFATTPPAVHLQVNGDTVATHRHSFRRAGGVAGGEAADKAPPGVTLAAHPEGCVGGVTILQYLALSPGATVALGYDGDVRGQGFMQLTKL